MSDELHPFIIDGVRHDSGCNLFKTPAFHAQRLACSCGAEVCAELQARDRTAEGGHPGYRIAPLEDRLAAADTAHDNRVRAAERERIAQMVERLDNTMMDQAKLAAYIRGQETV